MRAGPQEHINTVNHLSAPRYKAEVISDRLRGAVAKWTTKFTSEERDEIGHIIHALDEIAEGLR